MTTPTLADLAARLAAIEAETKQFGADLKALSAAPPVVSPPPAPPPATESPQGTMLTGPTSQAKLIDAKGIVWTLKGGVLARNGSPDAGTSAVSGAFMWGHKVVQTSPNGSTISTPGYWSWNGNGWDTIADPRGQNTPPPVVPPVLPLGAFHVANGQIIGPDGKPFIARGINVNADWPGAGAVLAQFPKINMIRLPTSPGADINQIDAMVNGLTSKQIVVLIEDHSSSGGNPNTSSGGALANECSWFTSVAGRYNGNPYVWFGTANEPDNTADMSAIVLQERAIYDAVRSASNTIVALELRGGYTADAALARPDLYATMRNTILDSHYYGWVANYDTDLAVVTKALAAQNAQAQQVRSADGVMPVIIGEYGPSTSGIQGYDANWQQVLQAIHGSGLGTLAWHWSAGTDTLVDNNGLTDFGKIVAAHIAAG